MAKGLSRVEGYTLPGFEALKLSFASNFADGWESEGAAFAAYRNGELVVDVWGGFAEKKYSREWREETLSTIFSVSKSIAAVCFAMQVERGHCSYDDLVTKYWPEFAANGKQHVTISHVLTHQSGLPCFSRALQLDDIVNEHRMDAIIEAESPLFAPGSKTAYQPFTHGWLVDAIFRRLDPKRRSLELFYKEEIRDVHNIDVYVGDCQGEEFRISRLKNFSARGAFREGTYDFQVAKIGLSFFNKSGFFARSMANMARFGKDFTMYNNPELRVRGQFGVNGVGTARALAKLHQLFMEGHFVSRRMIDDRLAQPQVADAFDHTIGEVASKGHGWMYWRGPLGNWQFGHSGVGGQNVRVDLENDVVYAYLCNGLKAGAGQHTFTFNRLEKKLFDCLAKERRRQSPDDK